ncbi:MAG: PadR family transcriptional regulator [Brevundimonas sp.]|nr:PadR family transcriptional regulator [Brevundimonas sp.]
MSLPHALLTSLAERPGSGSELASRFDRSIGYFWQATHQQIYRELGRLESNGWAKSDLVQGARGRKRRYDILPAGLEELTRWTSEALPFPPIRDELLVRLRAEGAVGSGYSSNVLKDLLNHHRQKLETYQAVEQRDFALKPSQRQQRLQHLVLKAGIEFERQRIGFCEEALVIIQGPSD